MNTNFCGGVVFVVDYVVSVAADGVVVDDVFVGGVVVGVRIAVIVGVVVGVGVVVIVGVLLV